MSDVKLTWKSNSGGTEAGFKVGVSRDGGPETDGGTTRSGVTEAIIGPLPGGKYIFSVKAFNALNQESEAALSNEVEVPEAVGIPAAPSDVVAELVPEATPTGRGR